MILVSVQIKGIYFGDPETGEAEEAFVVVRACGSWRAALAAMRALRASGETVTLVGGRRVWRPPMN